MWISGLRPHGDSLFSVDNSVDNLWIFLGIIVRQWKTNVLIHRFLKVIHSLSTAYPQGEIETGLHIIHSMAST